MNQETRNCQNCKAPFIIDAEDFSFYEKMKVPAPTFCPDCRRQRRLLWRNERSLYQRQCELCGKNIISMYSPDKPYSVYCTECWWSDKWDALRYGRAYDDTKPFFEQFRELMLRVPRISLIQKDAVNSPYANYPIHIKNCYLVFGGHDIEDSAYISLRSHFLKNCMDVSYSYSSELCYQCTNVSKSYMLSFSEDCEGCSNSAFLYDCRNCSDCFGCAGLRGKQYHIFNKPYSKEEYRKELEKLTLGSYKSLEHLKEQFRKFVLTIPRKYAMILQSTNVTGNDITGARNCRHCFAVSIDMENCAYLWLIDRAKDTYDVSIGYSLELGYEGLSTLEGQTMRMSAVAWGNHDATYVDNCHDCGNIFGCVGVRTKEYCILNKQYSKDEYEKLVAKITGSMGDDYGNFFPKELSPFCYNETIVQEYFPLTKEQALLKGYRWKDPEARHYEIKRKPEDLPDHIKDVDDAILKDVIGCEHGGLCTQQCTTAFKIIPDELAFYRRMNLPLPRLCPNCRHYERLKQRNPLKLWHRKCQCAGAKSENGVYTNTVSHFHAGEHCPNEFETSYAPDRKEIIYCEQCHQAEVV